MVIVIAPARGSVIVAVSRSVRLTISPSARTTAFAILLTVMVEPVASIAGPEMTIGRMTVAVTPSAAPLAFNAADPAIDAAPIMAKKVETMRRNRRTAEPPQARPFTCVALARTGLPKDCRAC